jgi:hypothetical protein
MKTVMTLLAVVALFVAGCASTTVNDEWRAPGYTGRVIHSVVVVGLPVGSVIGNQCSDEISGQLGKRGISATPGYTSMPAAPSMEIAMAKAREAGRDAVLVCRFVERKSQLDVYPQENQSMMLRSDVEIWPPNEYVENNYDVFQTILYDAATGKAIWSAMSDTYAGRSEKKVLESYVKTMLKQMERQGLISP